VEAPAPTPSDLAAGPQAAPQHRPRTLPLASSINSQLLYREDMWASSKRGSKASRGAMGLLDNIIAVTVYVVGTGLALSELYRFVQRAVTR